MTGAIVLIFVEGDDRCMYAIKACEYPTQDGPRVGDAIALLATKEYRISLGAQPPRVMPVTFLDGIYKVTKVRVGSAYALHPRGEECKKWYELCKGLQGFGITLSEGRLPMDDFVEPVIARVLVGY